MPLIFVYKGFKIRCYMNEESRAHVHVVYENGGEIKIWLNPEIEIARIKGVFTDTIINQVLKAVKNHEKQCKSEWNKYHG